MSIFLKSLRVVDYNFSKIETIRNFFKTFFFKKKLQQLVKNKMVVKQTFLS